MNTGGKRKIFFAGGLLADLAVKMKVPVFVGMLIAAVMTKHVPGGVILLDTVHNALFFKGFQGAVKGDPVRMLKIMLYFG